MQSEHPEARLILIAERDPQVRDLQRFFLQQAGLATEFVEDGATALERVDIVRPALIVTEILLPRIDGLALCRQLKEMPSTRHIPVIVFSILAASARAAEAGANAFLRKPLIESIFVPTVQDLIAAPPVTESEKQWASQ